MRGVRATGLGIAGHERRSAVAVQEDPKGWGRGVGELFVRWAESRLDLAFAAYEKVC